MLFNKKYGEDPPRDATGSPRPGDTLLASGHVHGPKPRKAQTRSIIDPGLIITGTLEGDGELQIDGEVHGDIRCTHLTVGDAATVEGSIAADEVVVRGTVRGVIGANRVVLADGAHVESDIFHKRLSIEEGARFEGSSRFDEQPIEKAKGWPGETQSGSASSDTIAEAEDAATQADPASDTGPVAATT
jgi:cytoskeletal protein CcmA (bactofilin family)